MPDALSSGVLIAFEGIDGSGKTTHTNLLFDWATQNGLDVVRTKEPTAGTWGAQIRNSKFTNRMNPVAELACFIADRYEHVETLIKPALARGALVLVDRYYYSTVAYQGARGLPSQTLLDLNRSFAPRPQLVVMLDIEPESGLSRVHTRGAGQDLFESLGELTKARAVFRSIVEPHVHVIDGTSAPQTIHAEVLRRLLAVPAMATWDTARRATSAAR